MDKGGVKWKYGSRKAAENIQSLGAVMGDVCAGGLRIMINSDRRTAARIDLFGEALRGMAICGEYCWMRKTDRERCRGNFPLFVALEPQECI